MKIKIYTLAQSLFLQSLLGLVQFDAGNLGPRRKISSFKINVELGSKC